jgi:hypothetical protein
LVVREDLLGPSALDQMPEIPNEHPVAFRRTTLRSWLTKREIEPLLQLLQELEDRDLNRNIKRRGRLVEDQQARLGSS